MRNPALHTAVAARFSSIPSVRRAAELESEISRTALRSPGTYYTDTARACDAFVIALPSVSCQDSRYAALAVANALFAQRLRTRLQLRDPYVL